MTQIPDNIKQLVESTVCALATVDENDIPNVIAISCAKTVSQDQILITDNFFNKTKINIFKNPHVSLAVWSKDEKEGFQLKGKAEYFTSGNWKKKVDKMKENEGLSHKGALLITIKEIWDLGKPKLICKE